MPETRITPDLDVFRYDTDGPGNPRHFTVSAQPDGAVVIQSNRERGNETVMVTTVFTPEAAVQLARFILANSPMGVNDARSQF